MVQTGHLTQCESCLASCKVTQDAMGAHMKAILRVMKYFVGAPKEECTSSPTPLGMAEQISRFVISGRSDSDYAKNVKRRRSISGYSVFSCGVPVAIVS